MPSHGLGASWSPSRTIGGISRTYLGGADPHELLVLHPIYAPAEGDGAVAAPPEVEEERAPHHDKDAEDGKEGAVRGPGPPLVKEEARSKRGGKQQSPATGASKGAAAGVGGISLV